LRQFSDDLKLQGVTYVEDTVGNVCLHYPGSGKGERVVLQGHVDMVTERRADSSHDFDTDPLTLRYDGARWLTADGTTLGADNGVGVCAALAVVERACAGEISVPPLEVLCTVAEEVGLVGAFGLDVDALGIRGTKLINLDSEDWPDVFVGCAGGGDSLLRKTVVMETTTSGPASGLSAPWKTATMTVSGLPGGHSGLDIHRGNGNAVVLAAELAIQVLSAHPDVRLVSICGGDKRNALARDAVVCLAVPDDVDLDVESLRASVDHPDARVELAEAPTAEATFIRRDDALSLLSLLVSLPHGVIRLEADGNVQTSSNVASIKIEGGDACRYVVQCSTRSSVDAHLERVRRSIRLVGEQLGFDVEQNEAYPGWQDAGETELRSLAIEVIRKTGVEPKVRTIHAGLEAGILKKKMEAALGGTVDAIAIGPTIVGAHSPDEACDLVTTHAFYNVLEGLLVALGGDDST
jgi:dipeptidase D